MMRRTRMTRNIGEKLGGVGFELDYHIIPHPALKELECTLLVRCGLAAMTASSVRRPKFKKFKLRYRVQCTAGPSDYAANPI